MISTLSVAGGIDYIEEWAVIIDFKATEVKDQKEADKRTSDSLQRQVLQSPIEGQH